MWDSAEGLALLNSLTSTKYFVENNEKDESAEILKDIGEYVNISVEEAGEEMEALAVGILINDEETAPDIAVLNIDSDED